ncbi:sodium-dependent glucose transporter 1A-like [Patella vulgata]|uniref:sodium-dependent glucose transporter 1A-like n=1 Tax=Patella vulgata TaxID=6465 RepID=UPI00218031B0|nr:sodium-dependent glucose transporter 1A-like [Patella vulgata]
MDKDADIQNGVLLESPVSAGGEVAHVAGEVTNVCGEVAEDETKTKSFLQSMKQATYRSKFIQSLALCFAFWCLGFQVGQRGPSFLDIQLITNTNVEIASTFFTAGSVGYLSGSFISGILYDRFNKTLLLGLYVILMAITVASLPLCSPYGLMLVISWANAFFMGGMDTGGNAHLVSLWGEDEGRPYMQAIHFSFAFGGVISPLVTAPFLVPKPEDVSINSSLTNLTSNGIFNTTLLDYNITNDNSTLGNNITTIAEPIETKLIYAYIISGILTLLSAIPFMVIYCRYKSKKMKRNQPKKQENSPARDLPWKYYILAIVLLLVFYLTYCAVEDTFAAYLLTFMVMELKWTKAQGTQITSVYWAAFAISRFSGIFIIRCLRPVVLLFICLASLMLCLIGFLLCSHYQIHIGIWIFAVLVGLSMSVIFPTGFSWAHENLLQITGKITSFILIAASSGTMTNPIIMGYLMGEVSPMWYCYLLVGESVLCISIFFLLLSVSTFVLVNKRIVHASPETKPNANQQTESIDNRTPFIPNNGSSAL